MGTISHNKIKASLNNDVIDFHRFSGRSVKSDLNEAEGPRYALAIRLPSVVIT